MEKLDITKLRLVNKTTGVRGTAVKYYSNDGMYLITPFAEDVKPMPPVYMLWKIEDTEVI